MKICDKPPQGWKCTREKDHDGPCAALPSDPGGDDTYDNLNPPTPEETKICAIAVIGDMLFGWSSENPSKEAQNAFGESVIAALDEIGISLVRVRS